MSGVCTGTCFILRLEPGTLNAIVTAAMEWTLFMPIWVQAFTTAMHRVDRQVQGMISKENFMSSSLCLFVYSMTRDKSTLSGGFALVTKLSIKKAAKIGCIGHLADKIVLLSPN